MRDTRIEFLINPPQAPCGRQSPEAWVRSLIRISRLSLWPNASRSRWDAESSREQLRVDALDGHPPPAPSILPRHKLSIPLLLLSFPKAIGHPTDNSLRYEISPLPLIPHSFVTLPGCILAGETGPKRAQTHGATKSPAVASWPYVALVTASRNRTRTRRRSLVTLTLSQQRAPPSMTHSFEPLSSHAEKRRDQVLAIETILSRHSLLAVTGPT